MLGIYTNLKVGDTTLPTTQFDFVNFNLEDINKVNEVNYQMWIIDAGEFLDKPPTQDKFVEQFFDLLLNDESENTNYDVIEDINKLTVGRIISTLITLRENLSTLNKLNSARLGVILNDYHYNKAESKFVLDFSIKLNPDNNNQNVKNVISEGGGFTIPTPNLVEFSKLVNPLIDNDYISNLAYIYLSGLYVNPQPSQQIPNEGKNLIQQINQLLNHTTVELGITLPKTEIINNSNLRLEFFDFLKAHNISERILDYLNKIMNMVGHKQPPTAIIPILTYITKDKQLLKDYTKFATSTFTPKYCEYVVVEVPAGEITPNLLPLIKPFLTNLKIEKGS